MEVPLPYFVTAKIQSFLEPCKRFLEFLEDNLNQIT